MGKARGTLRQTRHLPPSPHGRFGFFGTLQILYGSDGFSSGDLSLPLDERIEEIRC